MNTLLHTHQKKIALSLSAFVLPGLGQLHLKKRFRGWIMMLLSFFAVILTFWKFMMGVLIVLNNSHHKREPLLHLGEQLSKAFLLEKNWIWGGLLFIFLVWIWSILDIMKSTRE